MSSLLLGAFVALAGRAILPAGHDVAALGLSAAAVMLLLSTAGLLRLATPQIRRQTQGLWAKRHSAGVASLLWGLDIGLAVTTYRQFSGAWFVLVAAFLAGSVEIGAVLAATFFIGRALSVWLGPLLLAGRSDAQAVADTVLSAHRLFRIVHLLGLGLALVLLVPNLPG